jgi:thioredoxin 1
MTPILQDLANEVGDEARIIKIDVDKNPHIANHYQVRGVPTFIVFKNGEIRWQQAGMVSKQILKEKLS